MAMTLRADKGAILSWAEMDANFKACMGVHNLLHVQDQKATGTAGGDFTSGAWRTRTLNTVLINNIDGATISSNAISLPAGEYLASGYALAYFVSGHVVMLANSVASPILIGCAGYIYSNTSLSSAAAINSQSTIDGKFTLSSPDSLSLLHRCQVTRNSDGFGTFTGFTTEVYADLKIWKLS